MTHYKFVFQFIALIFLLPSSSFGQVHYNTINGLVLDKNESPMPFASVYVKNSYYGTITNEDGRFTLKIPAKTIELTASFIGYKTASLFLSNSRGNLIFTLEENSVQLREVVIESKTPENILEKAVEKIPVNYPLSQVVLHTFSREKLFVNDTLEYFAEAAFSIEKSYLKSVDDKKYIDKNRIFRFFRDTSINITLMGGVVNDFLKAAKQNFGKGLLKNNIIAFDPTTVIDERNVYVIKITPKSDFKNTAIIGSLYIDMQTYAFLKIELKYVHKNIEKYIEQTQSYDAHYRFVGDKCYPVSLSTSVEKYFYKNGITYKANTFLTNLVTNIDTVFDESINKNKVLFQNGNSLEYYPTDYDTTFWKDYTTILPDKETEIELTQLKQNNIDNGNLPSRVQNAKLNNSVISAELYHPHISFFLSSQTPNNLVAFNETYMSMHSLINYHLMRSKKTFKYGRLLSEIFTMSLSIPFQSVELERELFAKNSIRASYNPTIFNDLASSYCYGVKNIEMSDLKSTNYADFMRLHTVRKDVNYISIKSIEEKIVLANLSNNKVRSDYFKSYYIELFTRRFAYSIYYFPDFDLYSKADTTNENESAIFIDRPKSYVKYLFNPAFSYQRNVSKNELTSEESRFLSRAAYFSILNLVSPQTFGIKPFKLINNTHFTFSLSYLLIPFGEMFEQNFWIYSKNNIVGLFFRQYKNYNSFGAGLGLKFYNFHITQKLNCQTSIDYWYQPETLMFYDNNFMNGFGVSQTFEYKIREDKYNQNGDILLTVGYDYKTKGYQPQNLSMNKDVSVFCGIKYNFNKY